MNAFIKKFELCKKLKALIYDLDKNQTERYLGHDEGSIEKALEALTQLI